MPDNPFKVDDRVFIFNDPTPYYITFISKHGMCSLSNESGGIRLFGKYWGNLSFTPIMPTHKRDFVGFKRHGSLRSTSMVLNMPKDDAPNAYPKKRFYQVLDDMNQNDKINNTYNLIISHEFISSNIVDGWGVVTFGVTKSCALDILSQWAIPKLIIIDKAEFDKYEVTEQY